MSASEEVDVHFDCYSWEVRASELFSTKEGIVEGIKWLGNRKTDHWGFNFL